MNGLLESLLEQRTGRFQVTNARNPAYWVERLFGGAPTVSGVVVDGKTAMNSSAVYAACRIIAEDVATLPLPIYRKQGEAGRVRDYAHPLYSVLNRKANPEMTALTFRETLTGHATLRGNGYAEIVHGGFGDVVELWPLRTDHMHPLRNGTNGQTVTGFKVGQLLYPYTLPSGQVKVFTPDQIFNLRNFGPDGIRGYDLVTLAAESIGLTMAAEQYSASFYGNNGTPESVLTYPGVMTDAEFEKFQKGWKKAHEGLSNAHRIAILEQGLELKAIGIDPEKSALLASRKFQVIEFARWLRIPPTMLGELGDATFSNVGELSQSYTKFTLRGPLRRWEQQIAVDLIGDTDGSVYAEHVMDELLRGSPKERGEYYQAMRSSGSMTANQVADRENFERSDSPIADQLLVPMNMAPAAAYDQNGMTMRDRVEMAGIYVRAGFVPADVLAKLDLPAIAHTGLVPVTVTLDPGGVSGQKPAA